MGEPKYCFVQFKYSCQTDPSEEVRVVGNIPPLGNWDVNKAEKMVTSKLDYPVWKTKENIKLLQNTEIEYKYIIFKNNKFLRWEKLPKNSNRTLNVKNMVRLVIWDSKDLIGSKIEKFTKYNVSVESSTSTSYNKFTSPNKDYIDCKFDFRDHKITRIYYYNEKNNLEVSPFLVEKYQHDLLSQKRQPEGDEVIDNYKDLQYESAEDSDLLPNEARSQSRKEVEINENDNVIMVLLYLPFKAVKNSEGIWDVELTNEPFARTLWKISNKESVKWIGLLKNYYEIESPAERNRLIYLLEKKYSMYVIHIEQETLMKFNYLINAIFEPMFHYITLTKKVSSSFLDFEYYWSVFKEFNDIATKGIMKHVTENSLIFLHDYHFFLVPSLIYSFCSHFNQKAIQKISVGLFIHSAFPSYDVFQRFPYREEILKSMLNCSVVGFHTFDSSRNFLKCVRRILFLYYESTINGDLALSYYGRNLLIRVKNATVEHSLVENETHSEEFKKIYEDIKKKHKDKYIFVSLDNRMFLAGIMHKLEGYRRFLREIGDNARQNIFLQYISYSIDDPSVLNDQISPHIQSQNALLKQIYDFEYSITKEFGSGVVKIIHKDLSYTERLAILAAAKCLVRTCKRESFSIGIYEFLTLKILLKDEMEVAYILSEVSGVNSSLSGTIKINPFDINSIQRGFLDAFQLHFDHVNSGVTKEKDFLQVKKHNASEWLNSFLQDMKNAKENDGEKTYFIGAGTGLNFRLMKINKNFKELNRAILYKDYSNAKRRLLFIDNEGTLPPAIDNEVEFLYKGQKPHGKILSLLQQLTADKRNTVFIVSGRESKLVSKWFSSVPDLGLAAEHGFVYRYSSNPYSLDKWHTMLDDFYFTNDWRGYCVEQLEPYTERCEGSFIEVKEASVVWQYRDCDPEFGRAIANVVTMDLENSMKNLNLDIITGKGYVEVIAKGVNKGSFVSFILQEEIKKNRAPDFILAVGDDNADEEMFKYLIKKKSQIIGKKPSVAASYVNNPHDITNIIDTFIQLSYQKRASFSVYDVRPILNTNDSSSDYDYVHPERKLTAQDDEVYHN